MREKNPIPQIFLATLRKRKLRTLLLLLSIILVVVGTVLPAQVLRLIIDAHLVPKVSEGLLPLALLYLALQTGTCLFEFLKSALLTDLGQELVAGLRRAMGRKLSRLPMHYFSRHTPGSVTSHFTNDAEEVNTLFTDGLVNLVIDLSKVLGIFISICLFSARMALVTFFCMAVMLAGTLYFRGALFKAQKANLVQLARVSSHISETLGNVHTVKAYAREGYMEELYQKRLRENYRTLDKVNFYDSFFPTFVQVLKNGLIVAIILASAGRHSLLGISLGTLAASVELVSHLFRPIDLFGQELEKIQQGKSGLASIGAFLHEAEEEPKNERLTVKDICPDGRAEIRFDHVSYRYPDGDEDVIHDLCLTIEDKETLAFIGRTGVGKTTLMRLVLGLLKPTEGRIFYNGIPTDTIPAKLRRQLFGSVEQEFVPVYGGLFDQIRLYDSSITDERCEEVIRSVGLGHLVGTPFKVSSLSQGQKQLLSIARALATNPPLLIFDEITAALDAETEDRLVSVLMEASKERTVLSISHRERTMRSAGRLVYLKNGVIQDEGTPDEVLSRLRIQGILTDEQGKDLPRA